MMSHNNHMISLLHSNVSVSKLARQIKLVINIISDQLNVTTSVHIALGMYLIPHYRVLAEVQYRGAPPRCAS